MEKATFGGGCFWCLEPVFEDLEGVKEVIPGYAGGHKPHPTYEEVCTGTTGHAEVVQVTYDPEVIRYRDLLEVFFSIHDPTTPNRQGADVGHQYRSIILTHNPQQEAEARAFMASLPWDPHWEGEKIVTEVVPLKAFYPAEDYHRRYFRLNPEKAFCRLVIAPKYEKFRKKFAPRLKA
ncbi:MAG: peptide-methionine (S)-S-oxide reductase MsrA [Clostridiales bacterium]|nr:peptide-methionine (S)-S-oxide reductase MsrA [Clostridiales bacterium]